MERCSKVNAGGQCSNDLDTTGSPKWCKVCRARYQREYKDTVREMAESKAFSDGCAVTRDALARAFAVYPNSIFYGLEIAQKIHEFQAPKRIP